MTNFYIRHKYGILFLVPGIIVGFFYWRYVGCTSGTCPITSNWQLTVLFSGLIGFLIGDIIDDKRKKSRKEEQTEKEKDNGAV